jgi:FemAB-related protein (PEP-CTERM system-associated)
VPILTCKSEGEAVSGEWDEFVFSSPSSTISHLCGWRRIVTEAYGHKAFYLTARHDDEIVGILPLVQVKSRLFGNSLCSMPFQDYGGIIAPDSKVFRALLDQAMQLKKECGVENLELRQRDAPILSEGKPFGDKAALILDISTGTDALWKSFSPKVRNQIRKAEKSGLTTQLGGAELLDEFYRPFAVNMRDLGSPVHHPRFFEKIFSVFGDNARVMIVREGKRTVGGLIALFFKDTVVVPWASSFREDFPKCPNNLLYWDTIQYACSRGCTSFDFGRSSIDSGTYNFKQQWGANPVQLHWQVFSENSSGESRSLQIASSLWKHVPVPLANALGPYFRRYLTQ